MGEMGRALFILTMLAASARAQLPKSQLDLQREVTEVRRWDHDSAMPLDRLLHELETVDPGRDVDLVVGLAVAVPTFPEQLHNLGMARQMGRHFVVRSLHDLAEYDLVRGAF